MGAFLFSILISSQLSFAAVEGGTNKSDLQLVTQSVGIVAGRHITSREVAINSFIEDQLYRSKKAKKIYRFSPTNSKFVQETTAVLLEMAISEEGLRFPVAQVEEAELKSQRRKFLQKARNKKAWKALQVEDTELDNQLKAKMSAKKFIRFKVSSASLPITDQEAEAYFNKNRFKFDKLPFKKFKKNIKSYLNKKRVDARLREWFEVLQIKYSIRNQLDEGRS